MADVKGQDLTDQPLTRQRKEWNAAMVRNILI